MSSPLLTAFDPLNPERHLGTQRPTANLLSHLRNIPDASCTVVPDDQHGWDELLVWLPGITNEALMSIAREPAYFMNFNSADLLTSRSMMCFRGVNAEVRVDLWRLNTSLLRSGNWRGFGVVFMNESVAIHAAHHLSSVEVEEFFDSVHAQTMCTGPNYNPVQTWGDDYLDQHEGKLDEVEPGVIVPTCLSWALQEEG